MKQDRITLVLNEEDIHNLYDCLCLLSFADLHSNKLIRWFTSFFVRIEKIAVPDLYWGDKK